MGWANLGTFTLTYDWQIINILSASQELFRVSHLYTEADYVHGKVLVAQVFNNPPEYYNVKTFYPTQELKIVRFGIPEELELEQNLERRLAIKLSRKYYRYSISWQFRIDEFSPTVPEYSEREDLITVKDGLIEIETQLDRIENNLNS